MNDPFISLDNVIKNLGLIPLPEEGGLFKENFRSNLFIPADALPKQYGSQRATPTDIYYLLHGKIFSAFHRLKSDEIWHFHMGDAMVVHIIHQDGRYESVILGSRLLQNEVLRVTLPAGCWFAAEMKNPQKDLYALVSCVVAPGFEFADFELAKRVDLVRAYPQHQKLIERLARQ